MNAGQQTQKSTPARSAVGSGGSLDAAIEAEEEAWRKIDQAAEAHQLTSKRLDEARETWGKLYSARKRLERESASNGIEHSPK